MLRGMGQRDLADHVGTVIDEQEHDARAHPAVRDLVATFTRNLLRGLPAG
jgi:hypothetical protein